MRPHIVSPPNSPVAQNITPKKSLFSQHKKVTVFVDLKSPQTTKRSLHLSVTISWIPEYHPPPQGNDPTGWHFPRMKSLKKYCHHPSMRF